MTAGESRFQQRRRETHDRLMDAAYTVFTQRGYEAATVDEICDVAGNSKGAFYYHFESKEAVFLELLSTYVLRVRSTDLEAQAHNSEERRTVLAPLLVEFWAHAIRNSRVREGLETLYEDRLNDFVSQIGISNSGPVIEIARALIALEDGLLIQQVVGLPQAEKGREALIQRLLESYVLAEDEENDASESKDAPRLNS
jgi:AcrR family transcriptional regulator